MDGNPLDLVKYILWKGKEYSIYESHHGGVGKMLIATKSKTEFSDHSRGYRIFVIEVKDTRVFSTSMTKILYPRERIENPISGRSSGIGYGSLRARTGHKLVQILRQHEVATRRKALGLYDQEQEGKSHCSVGCLRTVPSAC
jgi:hypothetical protein